MDTQNLKTFLTLASVKNFTQTASLMYIAQSTVTNRIAELERELGKQLFVRSKKHLSLTREGVLFQDYARRILDLEEMSLREINSQAFSRAPLRVGTTNTIYECHLEPLLTRLLKEDAGYAINVTIGHSVNLLQMLQDGLLDMAFTYQPMQKNGFCCERFQTDELLLVTAPVNTPSHKAIQKEELPSLNYLFCNFALQEVGQFIRELFPPFYQFPFEIDNSTKLLSYLLEGIGCSFLPSSLVSSCLEHGSLVSIPLLDFEAPRISCYRCYPAGKEATALRISSIASATDAPSSSHSD